MLSSTPRFLCGAAMAAAASIALVSPTAGSAVPAYKLPASGKWKIQNIFEHTAGGSMTVSKSKTSVTALTLTVGPDYVEKCGTTVTMRGTTAIKRLSSAKRPAVGRTSAGSTLIKPKQVTFFVKGEKVNADLLILWEKTGRRALTASVSSGDCTPALRAAQVGPAGSRRAHRGIGRMRALTGVDVGPNPFVDKPTERRG